MYGPDQRRDDITTGFNDEWIAVRDNYPVTAGHTLLIPLRHIETPFELWGDEMLAFVRILKQQKRHLISNDETIEGFNIGFNSGVAAGQTIPHAHCHMIPRRFGDVDDPVGGVRNVIPGKGNYKLFPDRKGTKL
jgi:diadenosine tetraphosphate (Ap4A) HIT family hydrolase|tara:strand:- start:86 stop:487 length:402 start_codon:yes stop_codon:yes gene_type:complete